MAPGQAPIRYIELVNSVTADLPPLPIAELGRPLLAAPAKPLDRSRVILVTSAGVRLRGEPAFGPVNDLTYRTIPTGTDSSDLAPSHPTPVRRPGELDINTVYPQDRLRELAEAGLVGSPSPYHLSFLGTIKKLRELVTEMAPAMARSAREAKADLALLVPL
jgi:D-proline reductase (dithiol) PrdB